MVFKQKAMTFFKLSVFALFLVLLGYSAAIISSMFAHHENVFEAILLILPLAILTFVSIVQLEWFHVYEDRIEARSILGLRNVVCFCDVIMIEKRIISIPGWAVHCYFFRDGRKTHKKDGQMNKFTDIEKGQPTAYNTRKYCLRIHKTPELEEFIRNHPVLKDLPMKKISK